MSKDLLDLIRREKWEIVREGGKEVVKVYDHSFPLTHPVQIHLALYRKESNPEIKFTHMKAARDYLWPKTEWHYWSEDRYREHCNGWSYMGWAGGASTTKSFDAAQIALLFWMANPRKRGVVVASTTLESLGARVWGYVTDQLSAIAVKIPFKYLAGQAPKILYPAAENSDEIRSTRHGIFAVAAGTGDDDKAIANTIGRHPDDALMVILDECTDLNIAISRGFPNLDSSEKPFQLIGIGNSNSQDDLHGALCTPARGWSSIDPLVDTKWETTRKNGVCLFFSCYNSPAIHEKDPAKKKRLSRFLITKEQIEEKEEVLGKDSDLFYRFVLGFWRSSSTEQKVLSKEFLQSFNLKSKAEWLGIRSLEKYAGLDPAFSTGGDKCLLRLGILGQTVDGGIVLDYRGSDFLYDIKISAKAGPDGKIPSAELQIAKKVVDILLEQGVPLGNLAIDANGQGRALGGTIYLEMARRTGILSEPLKVYSTRGGSNIVNSFGMIIKTPLELWTDMRKFIEHNQIKGLDEIALAQLANRQIIQDDKTKKQRLQTKAEFKKVIGAVMPGLAHSPDEADSAILCLQAAIAHGFSLGQRRDLPKVTGFAHEKFVVHGLEKQEISMSEERWGGPEATFTSDLTDLLQTKIF